MAGSILVQVFCLSSLVLYQQDDLNVFLVVMQYYIASNSYKFLKHRGHWNVRYTESVFIAGSLKATSTHNLLIFFSYYFQTMSSAGSCFEYIDNITAERPSYHLLFLISPVNSTIWAPRKAEWTYAFMAYSGLFSFLFFCLGMVSVILLIKRDCARLKSKTFLAIYICLAVLGFTHALHLALDPNGILGWLVSDFPEWIIISRFLSVSGFPSITATYMLVFVTLYKSVEIGSSRLWHQDWRVVTILVLSHYLIAYASEIIANIAGYLALATVIICEAGLSIWGVVMCFVYFFTGRRLLQKLKEQCQMCVRMSSSVSAKDQFNWRRARQESNRSVLSDEQYTRQYNKISHTLRKVTIITYFTSFFTILYATVSVISLFFTSWFVFYQCLGFYGVGDPVVWLILAVLAKSIEFPLAVMILYSVTDFKAVMSVMCCCCGMSKGKNRQCSGSSTSPTNNSASTSTTLSASQLSLASLRPPTITDSQTSTHVPHKLIVRVNTDDSLNV